MLRSWSTDAATASDSTCSHIRFEMADQAYILGYADARFRDTGLERSRPLTQDIDWFKQQYGLEPQPLREDGPGAEYSQ